MSAIGGGFNGSSQHFIPDVSFAPLFGHPEEVPETLKTDLPARCRQALKIDG